MSCSVGLPWDIAAYRRAVPSVLQRFARTEAIGRRAAVAPCLLGVAADAPTGSNPRSGTREAPVIRALSSFRVVARAGLPPGSRAMCPPGLKLGRRHPDRGRDASSRCLLRRLLVLRPVLLAIVACATFAVVPATSSAADQDCPNFATQGAAQAWMNAHPGDPDGLDGDGDGVACETLPCPCGTGAAAPAPPTPAVPQPVLTTSTAPRVLNAQARITRVVDGDTIKVRFSNGVRTTVRLIGIDTPETKKPGTPVQCGGRDATARMKKLGFRGGKGRMVTVRTDPTQDLTDRYGRTLAYVSAQGTDFGRTMISSGWAMTYVFKTDFQRVAKYRSTQVGAKASRRGVYRMCGGNFHRG